MSRVKTGEFRSCKLCGKEFYKKKSHIEMGYGIYCSRKCQRFVTPNEIEIIDGVAYITVKNVSRGFEGKAIIDLIDLPKFNELGTRWHAAWNKTTNQFFAASNDKIDGKWTGITLHRFILDAPKGLDVDHINHNMLDCRRENLRVCTRSENLQNRQGAMCTSSTGIRNVHFRSDTRKWNVEIKVNYKKISLGCYSTIEEAEKAAIAGRKKYMTHSVERLSGEPNTTASD